MAAPPEYLPALVRYYRHRFAMVLNLCGCSATSLSIRPVPQGGRRGVRATIQQRRNPPLRLIRPRTGEVLRYRHASSPRRTMPMPIPTRMRWKCPQGIDRGSHNNITYNLTRYLPLPVARSPLWGVRPWFISAKPAAAPCMAHISLTSQYTLTSCPHVSLIMSGL